MNPPIRPRFACWLFLAGWCVAVSGCQVRSEGPTDRYIPSAEAGLAGLKLAMDGWLDGLSPADSGSTQPEVHVVDQKRGTDQRLERYEILGEAPADHARAFLVRATYQGVDEPEILRYLAVGVDPLWIFRSEDYETLWLHQEEPPADRAAEPVEKP